MCTGDFVAERDLAAARLPRRRSSDSALESAPAIATRAKRHSADRCAERRWQAQAAARRCRPLAGERRPTSVESSNDRSSARRELRRGHAGGEVSGPHMRGFGVVTVGSHGCWQAMTWSGRSSMAMSSGAAISIWWWRAARSPGSLRACWSLLHPWIVRRVGVHGRAAVIDGFGAQFVVPGFVAVDLA